MLKITQSYATLPAQDIKRARTFYEQNLGLTAEEQSDGGAMYRTGQTGFLVFPSTGKPSGDHTQLGLDVEDLSSTLSELRGKGVKIEEFDLPSFKTVNGIYESPDGSKSAWFKDTEGNLISVGQMVRVASGASSRGGASTSR
jgi:predicted enzyme related to lactoylglutathione lyase